MLSLDQGMLLILHVNTGRLNLMQHIPIGNNPVFAHE